MKLFAVRTIDGQTPVGFFWVRDLTELLADVDDIHDPGECECKPINKPAALVWPDETKWQMGVETGTQDPLAEEIYLKLVKAGMDFHGALDDFTCGVDVEGWKSFFAPAERWSDPPPVPSGPLPVPDGLR